MPDSDPIKTASRLSLIEKFCPDVVVDADRLVSAMMVDNAEHLRQGSPPVNSRDVGLAAFVAGCSYALSKIQDQYG